MQGGNSEMIKKIDNPKGEKTIVCWNCLTVLMVKEEWNLVECSFCEKINRVPHDDTDNKPELIKLEKNFNHFELNVPYVFNIVACPYCFTENRYRKNAEQVICYRCQHSIPIRGAIPREVNNNYNHKLKTPQNILNRNFSIVKPFKGLFPQPIIFNFENPCDCKQRENDFYFAKLVKKLAKRNEKKFKPVIPYDHYDPISEMVKDIHQRQLSASRNKENNRYIYNYNSQPDGFIAKSQGNLFKSFSPVKVQSINKLFFDYL